MTAQEKPATRSVAGIVLVDKPAGQTSNRVLQRVRRLYRAQKAGHTGTLDPMATGMLPICLGSATRVSGLMLDATKQYRVTAEFGTATDTGDATGTVTARAAAPWPGAERLEEALAGLRGRISQVPPMYSALHHEGRRLYELAREGREVPRRAREVIILGLEIEALAWPELCLLVHCSKGTYVRTLVTDLAVNLGTEAHVTALRRLSVGPFAESQMVSVEELETAAEAGTDALDQRLLGIDSALGHLPSIHVSDSDAQALRHGRRVPEIPGPEQASVRIYDAGGRFVGLGHLAASGELRPAQIFPV